MAQPPLRARRVVKWTAVDESRSGWSSWLLILVSGGFLVLGPLIADAPARAAHLHPSAFLGFGLLASLLGLYRPLGGPGLGLAAVLVVPVLVTHGSVLGAWVATIAALGAELIRRLFESQGSDPAPERRRPTRVVLEALRAGTAVLLAGLVYHRLPPELGDDTLSWFLELATARGTLFSAVTFAAALLIMEAIERAIHGRLGVELFATMVPLGAELLAWTLGLAAALAVVATGWSVALPLLICLSALSAQLARSRYRHADLERRIRTLRSVGTAGERVVPSSPEGRTLATNIASEILQSLDFSWFQLELPEPDGSVMSFRAGSDGVVESGTPVPTPSPPALPGIHRRRQWIFLDRELTIEDRSVGRLRLWCDPRRVDEEALETLDLLLPQLAVSADHLQLDRAADTDSLTGIAVRRVLIDGLDQALIRCREEGTQTSVVLCDVDHFKSVNDTWGHGVGDRALTAVADALRSRLRATDICCRYGGEEFALLLDGVGVEQALETAERLRRRVAALDLDVEGRPLELTISAGVAGFPELLVADGPELLQLADEALYAAKENGRNRVLQALGRGRFRSPTGEVLGAERPLDPPRL
ncbi:MAG: GGDEF domain-containing protein [Acidobacteriota bacterium]